MYTVISVVNKITREITLYTERKNSHIALIAASPFFARSHVFLIIIYLFDEKKSA